MQHVSSSTNHVLSPGQPANRTLDQSHSNLPVESLGRPQTLGRQAEKGHAESERLEMFHSFLVTHIDSEHRDDFYTKPVVLSTTSYRRRGSGPGLISRWSCLENSKS